MKVQTVQSAKPTYKIVILFAIAVFAALTPGAHGQGKQPYRFERINADNFDSQGWKEQEVNLIPGLGTQFADESAHLGIVCGPANDSDPRLNAGSVTMNLPTTAFPTLRRIRLRRAGYSGTFLSDLAELKYSTYLVHGSPTVMVLQIDVNGDEVKDFNIFYSPEAVYQTAGYPSIAPNTWQQWDALNGVWHVEAATIPGVPSAPTISSLIALYPAARIVDTPPVGNDGEGVRFTVGGGSIPSLFFNNVSYFDDLIIGTTEKKQSKRFDFMCGDSE